MYISSFLWRMRTCASLIRGNARIDTAVRRFTINTLICCSLKPYPYFLWSRTGIHHPMYLTGRVQFSSLIFEGKFLIFQGWKSSIVWYNFTLSLSPSLSLSLCVKVYWTVKITVIDEQCDGKFVFWVCACIKGCSRYISFFFRLNFDYP